MQSDYTVNGVLLTLVVVCFKTCIVNSTLIREGSHAVTIQLARKLVLL